MVAGGPQTFAEAIDVIEATYEFLLAYAALGWRTRMRVRASVSG
jgi:hypothetical protein